MSLCDGITAAARSILSISALAFSFSTNHARRKAAEKLYE